MRATIESLEKKIDAVRYPGPVARVLVSVREPAHREALIVILERRGHLVMTTNSLDGIQSILGANIVDVVIADPLVSGMPGYEFACLLRQAHPCVAVVLVSASELIPSSQALTCAICVSSSNAGVAPAIVRDGCDMAASPTNNCRAILTSRERQVLDLIIAGHASKVIAHTLGISQRTVEFHRAHIMRKTRTRNVAELVRLSMSDADAQPANAATKRTAA